MGIYGAELPQDMSSTAKRQSIASMQRGQDQHTSKQQYIMQNPEQTMQYPSSHTCANDKCCEGWCTAGLVHISIVTTTAAAATITTTTVIIVVLIRIMS